jgi:hypothetical protein
MPQNGNVQQLHFAISNIEVSKLEIIFEVVLEDSKQTPSKKYLTAKQIAKEL